MITKNLLVLNRQGIHARPAGMIVDITSRSESEVTFRYQDVTANARSILNVMMLAVIPGAELEVTIEGEDELDTMSKLEQLFEDKFHEEV
jgi:phosphocarrier protein HPr